MRGNMDSLPKWARDEIMRLDQEVVHWKKRAVEGPEDSNTFLVNMLGEKDKPLGKNELVAFKFGDHPFYDSIRVRLLDDRHNPRTVEIMCHGQMRAMPRASNVLWVSS